MSKSLRNLQRKPTHPGAILREDVLPALGITQTELAKRLFVSRLTVSELLHEKRGLSPDLAARIARLTSTTPESWLRMQEAAHHAAAPDTEVLAAAGQLGMCMLRAASARMHVGVS